MEKGVRAHARPGGRLGVSDGDSDGVCARANGDDANNADGRRAGGVDVVRGDALDDADADIASDADDT